MDYRRGALRVYAVATLVWVGWGLYKPVIDLLDRRATLEREQMTRDCAAESKKARNDFVSVNDSMGDADIELVIQKDASEVAEAVYKSCTAAVAATRKAIDMTKNDAAFRTARLAYRNTGYQRVALFCVTPPLALLIAGLAVIWVARGFLSAGAVDPYRGKPLV